MKNIDEIFSEVELRGFSIVENFLSENECNKKIQVLELLKHERLKKSLYIGNNNNQVLYNYFFEYPELFDLIHSDLSQKVISKLIDSDYVLTTASARNRQVSIDFKNKVKTSGIGWHSDGRYVKDKEIVKPSFSYFTIHTLDSFSEKNGATQYVPNSHKKLIRPERLADYKYKTFVAPKGSLIFMDTALWHRAGQPSNHRRWSVFNMFSSWFVKPYWDFSKMFKAKQVKTFSPIIKKLLHFKSTPPHNYDGATPTLSRLEK